VTLKWKRVAAPAYRRARGALLMPSARGHPCVASSSSTNNSFAASRRRPRVQGQGQHRGRLRGDRVSARGETGGRDYLLARGLDVSRHPGGRLQNAGSELVIAMNTEHLAVLMMFRSPGRTLVPGRAAFRATRFRCEHALSRSRSERRCARGSCRMTIAASSS
jgi:hypothetical protein